MPRGGTWLDGYIYRPSVSPSLTRSRLLVLVYSSRFAYLLQLALSLDCATSSLREFAVSSCSRRCSRIISAGLRSLLGHSFVSHLELLLKASFSIYFEQCLGWC